MIYVRGVSIIGFFPKNNITKCDMNCCCIDGKLVLVGILVGIEVADLIFPFNHRRSIST